MLHVIHQLTNNKYYWLAIAVLCVLLESAALFYQYVLNYGPCVLCIHVRIIVLGMFLVSIIALYLHHLRHTLLGANIAMTVLLTVLLERSYMLLGIERGFIQGSCSFDSGLPAWFSIDKWFPFMFEIWESCGYTPVLLFGITMAEALLVMSVILLLISLIMTVYVIREKFLNRG